MNIAAPCDGIARRGKMINWKYCCHRLRSVENLPTHPSSGDRRHPSLFSWLNKWNRNLGQKVIKNCALGDHWSKEWLWDQFVLSSKKKYCRYHLRKILGKILLFWYQYTRKDERVEHGSNPPHFLHFCRAQTKAWSTNATRRLPQYHTSWRG